MIAGILEGSPDGIGVVVVRLECGCRKMAAVAKDGEPASKVIIYRDQAEIYLATALAGDAVASGRHPQRALLDAREREIATRAARLDTALACREAALDAEFASGSPLVPPM